MDKQLETMYLVYDCGWYVFMRQEPYTEQELRVLASEMCMGLTEDFVEWGYTSTDYLSMPLEDVQELLWMCCSYEVLEVSLLEREEQAHD